MNQETRIGRPRQSDAERQDKMDRIIQIAQTLFAKEGYESVSMRKIAAKADMGTMTLYKYFPNKNAILHHIWAGFFDELFGLVKLDIEKGGTAKARLKRVCLIYLNYWVEHKDRFHIVFLNEDRASSTDEFFVNQANVAGEMLIVLGPVLLELFEASDGGSMMVFLESLICYLHGIALNVITISEYPWNDYEKYVDVFLDSTL